MEGGQSSLHQAAQLNAQLNASATFRGDGQKFGVRADTSCAFAGGPAMSRAESKPMI